MPHEALTPLGTQLRAVLANLSSRRLPSRQPLHTTTRSQLQRLAPPYPRHAFRQFGSAIVRASNASEYPDPADQYALQYEPFTAASENTASEPTSNDAGLTIHSPISPNDLLTDALHGIDANHRGAPKYTLSQRPRSKLHLSLVNPRSKRMWRDYNANRKRTLEGPPWRMRISLQTITARLVRSKADGVEPDVPSPRKRRLLLRRGYHFRHVVAWAEVVSAPDSLQAAKALRDLLASKGTRSAPQWLLLYALRREHMSPRALKMFMQSASTLFDHLSKDSTVARKVTENVFVAVMRFIRHARQVMPEAIEPAVHMLLRHLKTLQPTDSASGNRHTSWFTYLVNKLMHLVSITTIQHPFKDVVYQEAALVQIIKYMGEQSPPMHLNRQGYRAVVRVQLLQRKTAEERQWAELKSLAWPPWKVDRTAMDMAIDPEHGITRAGATLERMCQAGYRPLYWEKVAKIYTGWDTDNTPTIQMRVILGLPGARFANKSNVSVEPWAARIQSTRTIQEAWACYLAWEERGLPPDQMVILGILSKLHANQHRPKIDRERDAREAQRKVLLEVKDAPEAMRYWPLLPGDTKEISPPPPSSHLHTYTRTAPPSLDRFYQTLIQKGTTLKDVCVAFVVQHARTFEDGHQRLRNASARYPAIPSLMTLSPSQDVLSVPPAIFKAAIHMYARFSDTWLHGTSDYRGRPVADLEKRFTANSESGFRVNLDNSLVHAIRLLAIRPVPDAKLWTTVMSALNRKSRRPRASPTMTLEGWEGPDEFNSVPKELRYCMDAMNAIEVVRIVLDLQQENGIDLDGDGFYAFCHTMERALRAWMALLEPGDGSGEHFGSSPAVGLLRTEARRMAGESEEICERLKSQFQILVGEEDQSPSLDQVQAEGQDSALDDEEWQLGQLRSPNLDNLITVPSFAVIHAYVRALGWFAQYDELIEVTRWMRRHRAALAQQQRRDRRGADYMRRTVVALRVFLERSWRAAEDASRCDGSQPETSAFLSKLREPAQQEVIHEIREIVESVPEWHGWPSDEDVDVYASPENFAWMSKGSMGGES